MGKKGPGGGVCVWVAVVFYLNRPNTCWTQAPSAQTHHFFQTSEAKRHLGWYIYWAVVLYEWLNTGNYMRVKRRQQKARCNGPRTKKKKLCLKKKKSQNSMTWVKAVWVLKSLLETKINVDYIRLLKKKRTNNLARSRRWIPSRHTKANKCQIWTATANKHPFEPPQ